MHKISFRYKNVVIFHRGTYYYYYYIDIEKIKYDTFYLNKNIGKYSCMTTFDTIPGIITNHKCKGFVYITGASNLNFTTLTRASNCNQVIKLKSRNYQRFKKNIDIDKKLLGH